MTLQHSQIGSVTVPSLNVQDQLALYHDAVMADVDSKCHDLQGLDLERYGPPSQRLTWYKRLVIDVRCMESMRPLQGTASC
jgi:hypothetical protein